MSTHLENKIYLGKRGKIFGPYSAAEFEKLQATGEIHDYVWIWDHAISQWKPIELPPAAPEAPRALPSSTLQAVCWDARNLVSGAVCDLTELGCVILSASPSPSPSFACKSQLYVNLLDEKKGSALNRVVQLIQVTREAGQWAYQVRWVR